MNAVMFTLGGGLCLIVPAIILIVLISTMNRQDNGLAILSLVTGVLGLVPLLPLVGSIAAIVSGNMYLRQIRENPPASNSEGLAHAGIILGWIGVGLAIVAVLGVFLFLMPVRAVGPTLVP